ncbi:hypothetical protein ACFOLJ_27915 [Rugamonas sp. CCM 8940]|uniref:hypothetical protein n=1 Tax=Rugamonas sp. CCM 8940 TaxID=2765359 RepID=UPI00360AB9AB
MNDALLPNTIIASPVLHDKSTNLLFGAETGGPTATSEDRDVRFADGSVEKQRKTTKELMSYLDTLKYINYKSAPNSSDLISGTVDMAGYLQWLNANGYGIGMSVH